MLQPCSPGKRVQTSLTWWQGVGGTLWTQPAFLSFLWALVASITNTPPPLQKTHAVHLPLSSLERTQNGVASARLRGGTSRHVGENFMCCSGELSWIPGEGFLPGRLTGSDPLPLCFSSFWSARPCLQFVLPNLKSCVAAGLAVSWLEQPALELISETKVGPAACCPAVARAD